MNEKVKKNMHHIHDKSYKDIYSKKEIAIDLFRNYVNKEFTKDLNSDNLTLVNKSYISSDYEESESDIVYRAKIGDNETIFYILLEFQSKIDYRMPIRLFFYISEILREYSKNHEHSKNDKNIRIPAVVPIVLYNGNKEWDAETEFRKIYYNNEIFHEGILNFKYYIFDINNSFTKDELLKNKNATAAIFLLDQKVNPKEYLDRVKNIALLFNNLSEEELKAIKHWIRNTTEEILAEKAINILEADNKEVVNVVANNANIIEEMEEKAKKVKAIEIATNLLDVLDDETIALKTGLSIEEVKKLRKENM